MKCLGLSLGSFLVLAVAACGGRAALEAYQLGGTGAGGSTTSSSSSTSSSGSSTSSSGSSTSSSGGSSSSASSSSSSSSSGTTPVCDNSGDCQSCVDCAVQQWCQDEAFACQSNPQCFQFIDCVEDQCNGGPDPGCVDKCAQTYPSGAQLYFTMLTCLLCDACPVDCAGTGFCDPDDG